MVRKRNLTNRAGFPAGNAKMRFMAITIAILLHAAALQAQAWVEYTDLDDRFLVNFPGEPQLSTGVYTSELGAQLPTRTYAVERGASRYSLTVVDYTQAKRIWEARCAELTHECDGLEPGIEVRGSIAFAAWNYRKNARGEITYDAYAQVDGVPGHHLQITNSDGSRTFVAIHLHARRLYLLEGTVPEEAPPPGLFQQSLGILDQHGVRVRYIYGEDDRPIRVGPED